MKIVLTGSTGRIGAAVLAECIANPAVTSIVALTRRPLDITVSSPKLTNIVVTREQFLEPKLIQAQLQGADACVWAMGVPRNGTREVEVEYPLAFARIASQLRADATKPFRLVFTSGAVVKLLAAKDTDSPWFLGEERKMKTAVVDQLELLATGSDSQLEVTVVRPSLVVETGTLMSWLPATITFERLSAAMVLYALGGSTSHSTFKFVENDALGTDGEAVLASRRR
ncbi:hypothetical protein BKA62DRAFT_184136 [Auriculariales sp. MPI-PUGE-AT-0066]|nr:hypothetical protein BKA62DRAFT_184136 [Auriculariales sp. MPI-PUGE-AT-0066]